MQLLLHFTERDAVSSAPDRDNADALQEVVVFAILFYFTAMKVKPLVWRKKECKWEEFRLILYHGPRAFDKDKHNHKHSQISLGVQ